MDLEGKEKMKMLAPLFPYMEYSTSFDSADSCRRKLYDKITKDGLDHYEKWIFEHTHVTQYDEDEFMMTIENANIIVRDYEDKEGNIYLGIIWGYDAKNSAKVSIYLSVKERKVVDCDQLDLHILADHYPTVMHIEFVIHDKNNIGTESIWHGDKVYRQSKSYAPPRTNLSGHNFPKRKRRQVPSRVKNDNSPKLGKIVRK